MFDGSFRYRFQSFLAASTLTFLNANFDQIRDSRWQTDPNRFPGISQIDVNRYNANNCDSPIENLFGYYFDLVRKQDQRDGSRSWIFGERNNSPDITRSDIDTGLASWSKDHAHMQAVTANMQRLQAIFFGPAKEEKTEQQ